AFEHFDIHRLNRQMRFWPMILTGAVPALLSLLMVWPLATWLGDWRVLLYTILAQMGFTVITSHLVAERPYRLAFDRAIMRGSLRFGWPILVNSVFLFLVFQGDKLIVGRVLGMETLAIFAMGMTLTLTPTMVLAKSAQNFFLPQLSRCATETDEARRFVNLSYAALQTSILNGATIILAANLIGAFLINSLFGGKYDDLIPLFGLIVLLNGIRVFKSGPAQISLARGHTSNAMISNLPRVIALPFAWWILEVGGSLVHLLWIGIMAELTGYFVSLMLISKRMRVPLFPLWHVATAAAVFLVFSAGVFGSFWIGSAVDVVENYINLLAFIVLFTTMRNLHQIFLEHRSRLGPSR
ncbi:MAG: oligosaccharide flippase family protein, partial [Rhodobacterales bacterium]